jgi:hypothetical protein
MNSCEKVIAARVIYLEHEDTIVTVLNTAWTCVSTVYSECKECRYAMPFRGGIAEKCLLTKPCSELWVCPDYIKEYTNRQLVATRDIRKLFEVLAELNK